MNTSYTRLVSSAAAIALTALSLSPSVALAQSGTTPAVENDGSDIGDIVVTARKRSESLQSTPIAITAVSGEFIEQRGLTSVTELTNSTPNLVLFGASPISGSPAAASVFLRGLGQLDFAIHTDPGVGIYIDGVYIARSVGSVLDLVDLKRVEILRGPQGTLFGRNTIGGAINLISQEPADHLSGSLNLTTGSFNRRQVQGNISIPVSDTLLTKFTGYYHKRDGYVFRPLAGDRLGDEDALAGRFQALWKPSSDFTASLSIDATRRRDSSAANIAIYSDGTAFPLAFLFNARILGPTRPICRTDPNSTQQCLGAAWLTNNPRLDNGTRPTSSNVDIFGAALTLDYNFGGVNLKSITAYRDMRSSFGRDTDHTPFNFLYTSNTQRQHQFSQEFQLSGNALDGRLKLLAGAYYFYEKAFDDYISSGDLQGVEGLNYVRNSNYAFFTENTFDITPRLHLTAGLRYTHEQKNFQLIQTVIAGIRRPIGSLLVADTSEKRRTFNQTSPRVTLAYDVAPSTMIYATYSKGFKSGGFNARFTVPASEPYPYNPEFATLYEGGIKFQTRARDLRVNLAVFKTDYRDIQTEFDFPGALGTQIGNSAAARVQGFEAEFAASPIPGLTFDGSLNYLDGKYTTSSPEVPSVTVGNRLPLAAEWTFNVGLGYRIPIGNSTLTPRVDLSHRSSFFFDPANTPLTREPGYELVSASLTYLAPGERWKLMAGVKNLTDSQYFASAVSSDAAGLGEAVYGRPREWYVTAGVKF